MKITALVFWQAGCSSWRWRIIFGHRSTWMRRTIVHVTSNGLWPTVCDASEGLGRAMAWYASVWQPVDSLVTPLSERPLWCVAAGLLAGSLLGTAIDLPLVPLSGALLLAGLFLLLPWPLPQAQHCCRLGLVGLALTSLQLAWQPYALPAYHIARLLPSLPQHVTVAGTLARAVDTRGDRQYVYLQLHHLEGDRGEQPVTGLVRLSVHTTALPLLP